MKTAVKEDTGLETVKTQLIDAYKTVLKETGNQSLLSSLWSLVSLSSNGPPQLWDIKVLHHIPWGLCETPSVYTLLVEASVENQYIFCV